MIGQQQNIEFLRFTHSNGQFPRFLILRGPRNSGKATMAAYLAKHVLNSPLTVTEPGIDGVRSVIAAAYKATAPTCYIFPDADEMSTAALNALLKVTEEPPQQAYFILTASTNVLETLHSRATVITMQSYTDEELRQFTQDEDILAVATTPGQVKRLEQYGLVKGESLYGFCTRVLDSIHLVSGVNALKIPGYLRYKEEDKEGFEPDMFLLCCMAVCLRKCNESLDNGTANISYLADMMHVCSLCAEYSSKMSRKGVNKQALMDMWVFAVREVLT